MYDKLNVYLLLYSRISMFLENFQKPPSGWWTTARRLICFKLVLGFWKGNRLAAHSQPLGNAWGSYRFWVLGWRAWRCWSICQATQALGLEFDNFGVLGDFQTGKTLG